MKAKLYRMVTEEHICPYGIKSKDLLKKEGFDVEDIHLTNREQTDAFKSKHDVQTTPQTFIDDKRIGGYDDLVKHFNRSTLKQEGTTYQPIIAVFSTTLLMSLASVYSSTNSFSFVPVLETFIAFSMCVLAILKLRDLYTFSNSFITYDVIGKRYVNYAYIYPFAEMIAGVGMLSGILTPIVASISIFIGLIGSISVVKAVYIEKRDLKCACVGGDSNVPLGFISLTENLMMFGMGIWMLIK